MQIYAAPVCFIFDMVTNDRSVKAALISGLKQVLEDESVTKVMHDCRKPAAAIRYQLHIGLRSVFDTQVHPTSRCSNCWLACQLLGQPTPAAKLFCDMHHTWSMPSELLRLGKQTVIEYQGYVCVCRLHMATCSMWRL